MNQLAF